MSDKEMFEEISKQLNHPRHAKHILPQVKFLHDRLERLGNNMLREKDLTLAQAHVLGFLRSKSNFQASSKELEKTMNVAQSTSAGIITRLEKKNFIETFSDPKDKRVKVVRLTQIGLDAMQEIKTCFDQIEKELFSNLNQEQTQTFFELLKKINQNPQN